MSKTYLFLIKPGVDERDFLDSDLLKPFIVNKPKFHGDYFCYQDNEGTEHLVLNHRVRKIETFLDDDDKKKYKEMYGKGQPRTIYFLDTFYDYKWGDYQSYQKYDTKPRGVKGHVIYPEKHEEYLVWFNESFTFRYAVPNHLVQNIIGQDG